MSRPHEIGAALTPAEWAASGWEREGQDPIRLYADGDMVVGDPGACGVAETPEARHAAAALALHGQPFGFTWAMVDDLRAYAADYADAPRLLVVAARIAALLPPK